MPPFYKTFAFFPYVNVTLFSSFSASFLFLFFSLAFLAAHSPILKALVPGGVNTDTYRFSEAFEAGTIPLVEEVMTNPAMYQDALGPDVRFPSPFVSTWAGNQPIDIIRSLLSNVTLLNSVQADCINWWQRYKRGLANQWRDFIMTDYT